MSSTHAPLPLYALVTGVAGLMTGLCLAILLRPDPLGFLLLLALVLCLVALLLAPLLGLLRPVARLLHWCSATARAERAFRAGRLADAVALYAGADEAEAAVRCLLVRLPAWAPKHELAAATRELLGRQGCRSQSRARWLAKHSRH